MSKGEGLTETQDEHAGHFYGHATCRRSARIWALEERARILSIQKQASINSKSPSATSIFDTKKKKSGRKRKSHLLHMVVDSAIALPFHCQEGEARKHGAASKKTDQHSNSSTSQRMPKKQTLEFMLDILQRRDSLEIFAQPVDPDEVVGYYNIIKEPMDFGTIRAKLQEGLYTSLDQFQHDVFLISSNAMKFNSSTTVYYTEARAISELARRIFRALNTEPENFELEHSRRRKGPAKNSRGEAANLHNNLAKLPVVQDVASLYNTSLKEAARPYLASTRLSPHIDQTNNEISSGSRDGRNLNSYKTERRMTYKPYTSLLTDKKLIVSTVYSTPKEDKQLTPISDSGNRYIESLMKFVKDLGPTAQMVANKKIGQRPISTPKCLSWMPTSFCMTTDSLVPALRRLSNLTGVGYGHMPYGSISNSASSNERNKFCADGGVNVYSTGEGETIPTRNPQQGVIAHPTINGHSNCDLMQEKVVNEGIDTDFCGSSKAKMSGSTSDNMDLLIATLMQITAIQNRNSRTPSGSYFPLPANEALYPAQPSQLFTESQPSLQNSHSVPIFLPSQSIQVSSNRSQARGFSQEYDPKNQNRKRSNTAAATVLDHKYAIKSAQAIQLEKRIQNPHWDRQAIRDLPNAQRKVDEQILANQTKIMQQKSQVGSIQAMPLFDALNFLEEVNSNGEHAEAIAQYFSTAQQLTLLDNQQQPSWASCLGV